MKSYGEVLLEKVIWHIGQAESGQRCNEHLASAVERAVSFDHVETMMNRGSSMISQPL